MDVFNNLRSLFLSLLLCEVLPPEKRLQQTRLCLGEPVLRGLLLQSSLLFILYLLSDFLFVVFFCVLCERGSYVLSPPPLSLFSHTGLASPTASVLTQIPPVTPHTLNLREVNGGEGWGGLGGRGRVCPKANRGGAGSGFGGSALMCLQLPGPGKA